MTPRWEPEPLHVPLHLPIERPTRPRDHSDESFDDDPADSSIAGVVVIDLV